VATCIAPSRFYFFTDPSLQKPTTMLYPLSIACLQQPVVLSAIGRQAENPSMRAPGRFYVLSVKMARTQLGFGTHLVCEFPSDLGLTASCINQQGKLAFSCWRRLTYPARVLRKLPVEFETHELPNDFGLTASCINQQGKLAFSCRGAGLRLLRRRSPPHCLALNDFGPLGPTRLAFSFFPEYAHCRLRPNNLRRRNFAVSSNPNYI